MVPFQWLCQSQGVYAMGTTPPLRVPPAERKSGMPDSTEMPAPVKAVMEPGVDPWSMEVSWFPLIGGR